MGFAGGAITARRATIQGDLPDVLDDQLFERIQSGTFGKRGTLPDGAQVGFVGPNHLFETDFTPEAIAFDRYLSLQLRVEQNRVPPAILRSYVRLEEQTLLEATGRAFLSRGERRQAKEAAALRADQESRGGAFRRIQAVGVVIDLQRRMVYLASAGATVFEQLAWLLREALGVQLEPHDLSMVVEGQVRGTPLQRPLESVTPTHLIPPPDGPESAGLELRSAFGFLGREFLTWVWHQTDTAAQEFNVHGRDYVGVMIDKRLKLDCDFDLTGSDTITADQPDRLPEARAALRVGKQPVSAGLVLTLGGAEYRLVLNAAQWSLSSLIIPDDEQDLTPDARQVERLDRLSEAYDLLDGLLELFLQQRLSSNWEQHAASLRAWATDGLTLRRAVSA